MKKATVRKLNIILKIKDYSPLLIFKAILAEAQLQSYFQKKTVSNFFPKNDCIRNINSFFTSH